MTRDDIIRMAREADAGFRTDAFLTESIVGMGAIERFAALVAAAEREACAEVCEERGIGVYDNHDLIYSECADLIRSRKDI